ALVIPAPHNPVAIVIDEPKDLVVGRRREGQEGSQRHHTASSGHGRISSTLLCRVRIGTRAPFVVRSLADDLRACIGGLVVSQCVVLDAAHEAASLGTLERGLELRGQRLGLLRVAEKASALAGSRAKPKEYVGFREFGI